MDSLSDSTQHEIINVTEPDPLLRDIAALKHIAEDSKAPPAMRDAASKAVEAA